ncbi:hypothetical protein JavanS748_0015 [Streptococcus satellite phage Javan748]|nr:hypothetical protein JavanS748_0015 [Streptococcus satellite phage Javan748]
MNPKKLSFLLYREMRFISSLGEKLLATRILFTVTIANTQ